MTSQNDWQKVRDEKAKEQGIRHANPVIRSMYPSTSRGQMANQFAQLYSLGYSEGRLSAIEDANKILVSALKNARCDEVINYEGSGMFNKHDTECRICKALAAWREVTK